MAFFDDMSKKISAFSQTAVQNTKSLGETTKLNAAISSEDKRLQQHYAMLGQKYYELYADTTDANFAPLCAEVAESLAVIAAHKADIERVKTETAELTERVRAEQAAAAQNVVRNCVKCGAELSARSKFCGSCGFDNSTAVAPAAPAPVAPVEAAPVEEVAPQVASAPVEEAAPEAAKTFCSGCGVELPPDTVFCGNCGTKAE